jgi:chromosome segregation ATPase
MADEKPPEGGTAEKELEAAIKRIAELEAKTKADADALAKLESINRETVESRQKAKEREQKALEEQGQYKTVSELQAEELKKLKADIEEKTKAIQSLESVKAKADAYDAWTTKRRAELLETLPEETRKTFESESVEKLEEIVKLINPDKGGSHKGAGVPPKANGAGKKWAEMTNEERRRNMETLDAPALAELMSK